MVALSEMKSTFLAEKRLGETPLQCLERIRMERNLGSAPLTYAGRLDPMAEGLLLVLAGEECKKKADYLGLDKVYETEFLLGVETDTYDLLGLVQDPSKTMPKTMPKRTPKPAPTPNISREQLEAIMRTFLGKRAQVYPPFSSKPHNGRPLFSLARAGELPTEEKMPSREVEIFSIDVVGERAVAASELEKQIVERISRVRGDFRQAEIVAAWQAFFQDGRSHRHEHFQLFSLRVHCSSGTYIRSLAHEAGRLLGAGVGATTFSIRRTQVGDFLLSGVPDSDTSL